MSGGTSKEGMRFDYTVSSFGSKFIAGYGQRQWAVTLPIAEWGRMRPEAQSAWRKNVYARAGAVFGIRRGGA